MNRWLRQSRGFRFTISAAGGDIQSPLTLVALAHGLEAAVRILAVCNQCPAFFSESTSLKKPGAPIGLERGHFET